MVGMWPIYEWDEWDVYPVYPSEIAGVSSLTQWDADPFMPHRTVTPQKSRPNFGDVGTLMIQVEVTHKKDRCSTELSFWLRTNPHCCFLPIFEGRKVTLMDKLNELGWRKKWERDVWDARDAEVLRKTPMWGPVTGPPCSKLSVSTSVQSDPLLHVLERPHRGNCPLWMSCCHGLKLHQINRCACKKQEKHQGESNTLNSSRSSSTRNFVVLKVKRLLLNMEKDRWSQGAMQHDATMAQAFYTKKSQKSLWDLLCYRVFSLD